MKKRNFGHFKEVTAQKNKCANKAAVQALGNNWVHSLGSGEGSGEGLAGLRFKEVLSRLLLDPYLGPSPSPWPPSPGANPHAAVLSFSQSSNAHGQPPPLTICLSVLG